MKNRSLGLGSLLLLGIGAVVVMRLCAAARRAQETARREAARAEKARWENEGGSPATPAVG